VRNNSQFAGYGDCCPLEAVPLVQHRPSLEQIALGMSARQDHSRGFIEHPSQMGIATSGDVAVLVDLCGLIAASRQAQLGSDRA
jgi:hypothetical protein